MGCGWEARQRKHWPTGLLRFEQIVLTLSDKRRQESINCIYISTLPLSPCGPVAYPLSDSPATCALSHPFNLKPTQANRSEIGNMNNLFFPIPPCGKNNPIYSELFVLHTRIYLGSDT